MNRSPIRIDGESLAVEAINLMRERAVTVLPVVDGEQRVVGIVHLHDLIRAGLA
jgi:arabinose-5-phosphate isomerase